MATVKSLQSYFEKMPEIIRSYYSHHNASQEEAEILVNYCDRAAQMIKTVKNHGDLIKLYDYLIAFKGQLSKYNHRKHKYRWSVSCLENQVLTKLQQISILQNYQSDRLNYLLTQPDLAEKIFDKPQSNFIDKTPKQIQTDLKNKLSQFRKIYHQDKKLILDRLIAKVTVSIETLENITLNKFETIILENTPRGKYWIIDYSNDYYLIPSEEITVSYYKSINITNIAKTLFDFAGYYPEYSSSQLIRPALVSKVSSKQWKLEKKGKLIFS